LLSISPKYHSRVKKKDAASARVGSAPFPNLDWEAKGGEIRQSWRLQSGLFWVLLDKIEIYQ